MKAILVLSFIIVSLASNKSMACEGKNMKAEKKEKSDVEKVVEEEKVVQSKKVASAETKEVKK